MGPKSCIVRRVLSTICKSLPNPQFRKPTIFLKLTLPTIFKRDHLHTDGLSSMDIPFAGLNFFPTYGEILFSCYPMLLLVKSALVEFVIPTDNILPIE
jgi:hypothetical protein